MNLTRACTPPNHIDMGAKQAPSDADMQSASTSTTTSTSSSFASPRTVLPSSVADFALAHSPRSAPPSPSSPVLFMDDPIAGYLPSTLRKLRRPSLLGLGGSTKSGPAMLGSAPHSPLASSSFGPLLPLEDPRRRGRSKSVARASARATRGSQSNSDSSDTPPGMLLDTGSRPRSPSTPPSRPTPPHRRALSAGTPFKIPRLLSIQSELANPADAELKSEASFQRLLASNADLPGAFRPHPRPRRRDRGRFPEVYLDDDEDPVESDDDDDDDDDLVLASGSNEALPIPKPANGGNGRDEYTMEDVLDSPARMDIDMGSYGSPPVLGSLFSMKGWRQTPPPTVAPLRTAKRKLEDRYEPYPQKRRAISPPSSSNALFNLSLPPGTTPRSPVTTAAPAPRALAPSPPINIPAAACRTPNHSNGRPGCHTPTYGTGTPMMLYGSPIISSPVMRPVRFGLSSSNKGEREVDGAGNGVRGLDLGG